MPLTLALTSVTADQIKQQMISILRTKFTDWSDVQDSNNMIMLLETISAVSELSYAYINRMAREAFIQYALDYRNVFAHARGIGYYPAFQTPSTVQAIIQSASVLTADTVIPAGSQFNCTLNTVIYETTADVTIAAGQTTSDPVILNQQQTQVDQFQGTALPNQQVTLNGTPVMPDANGIPGAGLTIQIDGAIWTFVQNFIDSSAVDRVFTYVEDSGGTCTIVFGDGISGQVPPINATGSATYRTGGGSANAIGANQLSNGISDVHDNGTNSLLSLNAVNTLAAVPGADVETMDQVRANAVANLISPRVLLTRQDIQSAVSALSGVLAVNVVNWEVNPNMPHYLCAIYVVPVGLGQPSPALITAITTLVTVTKPMVMGQEATVLGPKYVTLNFNIQLGVTPGYSIITVQNSVKQLLAAIFNPVNAGQYTFSPGFGIGVYTSQITALIQQLPGVRNLTILTPGDTTLTVDQFPLLGTTTFV